MDILIAFSFHSEEWREKQFFQVRFLARLQKTTIMITIEYYTIDNEGNDVKVDQEFTITKDMIVKLLEEHIDLDRSIGEEIDEQNIYIKKR